MGNCCMQACDTDDAVARPCNRPSSTAMQSAAAATAPAAAAQPALLLDGYSVRMVHSPHVRTSPSHGHQVASSSGGGCALKSAAQPMPLVTASGSPLMLTPLHAAPPDCLSAAVIDLDEIKHKGHKCHGPDTLHLQIYPLAFSENADGHKERHCSSSAVDVSASVCCNAAKGPPLHPPVCTESDRLSYAAEVQFIRSFMDSQMSCEEWQLVRVHRLLNPVWLTRFIHEQQRLLHLSPSGAKSAAPSKTTTPHASPSLADSPALVRLLRGGNNVPCGFPVFCWHTTKSHANVASIMSRGLSVAFAVRGGPHIFFSQHFSHSISYTEIVQPAHVFLCLVLMLPEEIALYGASSAINILSVADEKRVLPLYHIVVQRH